MKTLKKILNRLYTWYLKIFHIDIQKNAMVDYRCDIEQKTNIMIGIKSILYKHITIYKEQEGNLEIGKFSHIAPYGYFLLEKKKLVIGDNVAIGPFCSIFCISNAIPKDKTIHFKDCYLKGDVIIGNNVFIGAGCVILPNTIIENNVVVAAHSTVKGILKSGYLYGGNPVKSIKSLDE